MGTPEYMAPEQGLGKEVDGRADIYSLGVILYELVTGRKPYTADTPMAVIFKHMTDPLPRPTEVLPRLSKGIEKILLKALAKDPANRYQSMEELVTALGKVSIGREKKSADFLPPKPIVDNYPEKTVDKIITPQAASKPRGNDKPKKIWVWFGGIILILSVVMILVIQKPNKPSQVVQISTDTASVTIAITRVTPSFTSTKTPLPTETLQPTLTMTPTPALGIGSTQISSKDGMVMMYVPAGDFIMGSDNGDSDERPVHTVYLDAFWIDQTEVTNAMYRDCVANVACSQNKDYRSNFNGDQQPVVGVTWNQAVSYCEWVDRQLPSEAQWEKAARGEDERTYPWGEGIDSNKANYDQNVGKTTDVGNYEDGTSPYGALDMAGNVWEWVADWHEVSYYHLQNVWTNPPGPVEGYHKVTRGGSWNSSAADPLSGHGYANSGDIALRVSSRANHPINDLGNYLGFRCSFIPIE